MGFLRPALAAAWLVRILATMVRPCFLVIDREYSGSISTRKLIIETAKFNVLTAYSAQEAIDTLARFPGVSGVVLDGVIKDMECGELIRRLKQIASDSPVMSIDPRTLKKLGAH